MVETKNFSVYDENNPPLVQATLDDTETSRLFQNRDFVGGPDRHSTNNNISTESVNSQPPPPSFSQATSTDGPSIPTMRNQDGNLDNRNRNGGNSSNNNIDQQETNDGNDPRMAASGIAGAVIGFLFGGFIGATLCGFGAAYFTQKPGATGDAARALGDVAISAKTKAEEIDRKHNVVDKSKQAAADMWEQAKEYDRRNNVLNQVKDFVVFSWKSFAKFIQDHRVLERGVDGVGRGFEYAADRVAGGGDDDNGGSGDGTSSSRRKDSGGQRRT